MATAQGTNKIVSYKKQTALGTPASGSGGEKYRRRSSVFTKPVDSFENDEIVDHQQSTGETLGGAKPIGKVEGLLSPGAYPDWFESLLRRLFTTVAASTGLSITIAASGGNYTVTRSTGSWLTDGVKAGYVGRLSGGSFNANNSAKNLLVINVTALVLTVRPLNASTMTAEGPIASATFTLIGKVTYAPTSGHTYDTYTFEEWYPDVPSSETYPDAMIAKADVTIPASGNVQVSWDIPALKRVAGASQVLTAPAAAATNRVLTGAFGLIVANGAVVGNITAANFSLDGATSHSDLVLGSQFTDDMQRGRIKVTGQFVAKFSSTALQTIFDAGSVINLIMAAAEDGTGAAGFISFVLPAIKLKGDAPDDGEKQVLRTYPFTAEYFGAGGAGTSSEQSIFAMQDSAA